MIQILAIGRVIACQWFGARERLAAILMTGTTTGLAITPLVLASSIPDNEIEHPMAIVIVGGLVTAMLLNLFVVPSLYLRWARRKDDTPESPVLQAG